MPGPQLGLSGEPAASLLGAKIRPFLSSYDMPQCTPPEAEPRLILFDQRSAPVSGLSAQTTPAFWPAITTSDPSLRLTSMEVPPKSKSGLQYSPGQSQLAPRRPQAEFQMSFCAAWNTQRFAPVLR